MKAVLTSVCTILAIIASVQAAGTNWAVLIAGSNTYMNYRHQSDICHAYQILHKNGIPDSNIIVMMYDDIANNSQNPYKGNIINKPNGPNVYPGVPKDYTGSTVTAKNFLAVLNGDEDTVRGQGTGRVLKSGPEDNVFVYFSDHGGPGLIAMPTGPYLYAKDLSATLQNMYKNKRYGKLVFYMEACESGSMFYNNLLPNNINIYATSASSPTESSYACYWDSSRQAYLGDLYSVSWMENSDIANFNSLTLESQYLITKNATNLSQVMEWGQLSLSSELVGAFQGAGRVKAAAVHRDFSVMRRRRQQMVEEFAERSKDAVDSRDIVLATLTRRLDLAKTEADRALIQAHIDLEVANRNHADKLMRMLVSQTIGVGSDEKLLAHRHDTIEHDCLQSMVETFESRCGRFNDYSLKYAYVLNNLCGAGVDPHNFAKVVQQLC